MNRIRIALVAATSAAVGLLAGCGGSTGSEVRTSGSVSESTHPFDPYFGFGRSPAAAGRDDTVALWEAFTKEREVAGCMRAAGFDYEPAVAFPTGAVADVGRQLGISAADHPPPEPSKRNDAAAGALDRVARNRYFLTLNGETAEAVDRFAASEGAGAPADFGSGGCVGEAEERVGSVWELNRRLEPEVEAMHRVAAERAGPAYAACVGERSGLRVDDPGDIESLLTNSSTPPDEKTKYGEVFDACMPTWDAAVDAEFRDLAASFIAEHRVELESFSARYEGAMARIKRDDSFRKYVAEVLGRVAETHDRPAG
jgi:hypothetical protein